MTLIKNDEGGSCRIVKSSKNTNRDDVASALVLASGALKRDADAQTLKVRSGSGSMREKSDETHLSHKAVG